MFFKKFKPKYIKLGNSFVSLDDIKDCNMAAAIEQGDKWKLRMQLKYGSHIERTYETKEGCEQDFERLWCMVQDIERSKW
jgi:hypothetical protein